MSAPVTPQDLHHHSDHAAQRAIERGELRSVCAKRARKLRKRGARVFFSTWFGTYAWNPKEPRRA